MKRTGVSKNVTQREWIFGDFDKDGVKNIDDPYPLDKKRSKHPDIKKNPKYYHKARYGGTEAKLSDEILAIENYNNRRVPFLLNYMRENPGNTGRIKTVPSTMQKLRYNYIDRVSDISGVTHVVKKRKDVYSKVKHLKGKYRTKKSEEDDFYSKPLSGVYYAYHLSIFDQGGNPLEVQVKTSKMLSLQDEMHGVYKSRGDLSGYKKVAKKLFDLGF